MTEAKCDNSLSSIGGEGRGEEAHSNQNSYLIIRARELRRHSTNAEHLLWSILRDRQLLGLKFRRQHPVHGYIADFACTERRLIIEADGGQHNTAEGFRRDAERTAKLKAAGWRVLRFWNHDILSNLEGVVESLLSTLTPTLSLIEGEGVDIEQS